MIKVVSFDIGGTLLEAQDNDKYNFQALSNLTGKPYDSVSTAYKNIFQKRKGTFDELVNMFCQEIDYPRNNLINDFFHNKFSVKECTISENTKNIIKKIKDMGYKIILFSNSCCLFKNVIDKELAQYIDNVFYSFDIGYTKSDNESYQIIAQKMGCLPQEFLHIGDTLKSDYLKPIENGWHAIYYGDNNDKNIESIKKLQKIFKYLN